MSDSNVKRKHGGSGDRPNKKSKVSFSVKTVKEYSSSHRLPSFPFSLTYEQKGNNGKWKTSHHKAKIASHIEMGKSLDVADEGIWVTFARGMKNKAIREFKELCDEVCKPPLTCSGSEKKLIFEVWGDDV